VVHTRKHMTRCKSMRVHTERRDGMYALR
jgi:hypothetical protein